MKIVVVGGGAAGFFAAIAAKKTYPQAAVILHERTAKVLSKVRISGGGRCNVTHACFDPKELVKNYPRGSKELLGPFHRFQPADTIQWFSDHGVELKTEEDGRVFPLTDSSQTIIDCLMAEANRVGVQIRMQSKFALGKMDADRLILATGSSKSGWEIAEKLGHTIQPPVPSLFTFNIPDFPLESIAGISVRRVHLGLEGTKLFQEGPLLITHWGFSGPAALKLSAFGARYLAEKSYEAVLYVDWLPEFSADELISFFSLENSTKKLGNIRSVPLPKRLWKLLLGEENQLLRVLSKPGARKLCEKLKSDRYQVRGKTTNKEEFVTCGGVTLSEVNFKTMESKICPGLYFCGEMLDIDGVTGGFNFQNAWTTGWIAGTA
ncbi:MAG: NAD(P)/FAD-dependent oxidoreductase [Chlamydiales bacterium]